VIGFLAHSLERIGFAQLCPGSVHPEKLPAPCSTSGHSGKATPRPSRWVPRWRPGEVASGTPYMVGHSQALLQGLACWPANVPLSLIRPACLAELPYTPQNVSGPPVC